MDFVMAVRGAPKLGPEERGAVDVRQSPTPGLLAVGVLAAPRRPRVAFPNGRRLHRVRSVSASGAPTGIPRGPTTRNMRRRGSHCKNQCMSCRQGSASPTPGPNPSLFVIQGLGTRQFCGRRLHLRPLLRRRCPTAPEFCQKIEVLKGDTARVRAWTRGDVTYFVERGNLQAMNAEKGNTRASSQRLMRMPWDNYDSFVADGCGISARSYVSPLEMRAWMPWAAIKDQ